MQSENLKTVALAILIRIRAETLAAQAKVPVGVRLEEERQRCQYREDYRRDYRRRDDDD